jgi:hypothetical protein
MQLDLSKLDLKTFAKAAGLYAAERGKQFIKQNPDQAGQIALDAAAFTLTTAGAVISRVGAELGKPGAADILKTEATRFTGYLAGLQQEGLGRKGLPDDTAPKATEGATSAPTAAAAPPSPAPHPPPAEKSDFGAKPTAPLTDPAALKKELAETLVALREATGRAAAVQSSISQLLGVETKASA